MVNAEERRQWSLDGKCYTCGKKLKEGYEKKNCPKCLNRYKKYGRMKKAKEELISGKPKRKYVKRNTYQAQKTIEPESKNVITINIPLEFEREGKDIVCDSQDKVAKLVGSKSAVQNPHMFGITKKNGKYYVPLDTLKDRHKDLKARVETLQQTIKILDQMI